MEILNGNSRYSLPRDDSLNELVCGRLQEGELVLLRPDLGVKVGNIRVGKRAYNCAFVLSTKGVWVYMSKSTFLTFVEEAVRKGWWGMDIGAQYECRSLSFFIGPVERATLKREQEPFRQSDGNARPLLYN